MTTEEIIATVRQQQRSEPCEVVICGNAETITQGYFLSVGQDLSDEAAEIFQAGADVIRGEGRADCRDDSNFSAWHGGTHYCAGKNTYLGVKYGYSAGFVVTHEKDPPQWLCDLCDRAAEAMAKKGIELGCKQTEQLAQDVIDDIERGDEPCEFVVENLSREELSPELSARLEAALSKFEAAQLEDAE